MGSDVLDLEELDRAQVAIAGGKGANLGALLRIEGIRVPDGFCVTTEAFGRIVATAPAVGEQLDRLAGAGLDDPSAIRTRSAELRRTIEAIAVPDDLAAAIARAVGRLGDGTACAVRSSATAEDQPLASFAGQHDTYLDIVGAAAIVEHVRRCWASLFTERAVTYRVRNGVDHRSVQMAVVVQRLVVPHASGVVFTADPVTGDRTVVSVEAGLGLGEALVSGAVTPDAYRVRGGEIVDRSIADRGQQVQPALTDAQVLELEALGRKIEGHFGQPQDVEWCLADDGFQIVQTRPITTLFPIPVADDGEPRVYVSVGHQQMMTDPMKPLGLSVWQMIAFRPMYEAGGRLFVDVTAGLASSATRAGLIDALGTSDPLIGDALQTIVEREGFLPSIPDGAPTGPPPGGPPPGGAPDPVATDPAIVTELIERAEASLAALQRDISSVTGSALLDLIEDDIAVMEQLVFDPRSRQVIMAAMEATWWLNDQLEAWLGEPNAADALTRSVPGNVTSEMGLALLDVADAIRPHPEVVAFLEQVDDDGFLDGLAGLTGGREAGDAIRGFLDRYGMRCVGEIDLTRPRWSEHPAALVPVILSNVEHAERGAGPRRFEEGRQVAAEKERDVLARLRALPGGDRKADEAKQMIDRVRTFAGYREHPKYVIVGRTFAYKRALLGEADRLVRDGVLRAREDGFFLTFPELREVVRTGHVDGRPIDPLIDRRREAFASFQALTPPRVITSDGEVIAGSYQREGVPAGALVGLAVSTGTIEGRARIVHDMEEADLEPGDILVTTATDPSWSPLFVAIAGLVTEVGGLMTHGAVIAREYGLPAVVGVEHATRRIADGQRIRVHGADGYVELLS